MFGWKYFRQSHSGRDLTLLFISRVLRLFAFGAVAPILVLYLRELQISDEATGAFLTATLIGDGLLSFFITWFADRLGRRLMLGLGSCLMGVSGVTFAITGNYVALLLAAIFGVISPSASEIGPFQAIEVGILSQILPKDARIYIMAWYQALGWVGASAGGIASGQMVHYLATRHGWDTISAYGAVFWLYAFIALLKLFASLTMTSESELGAIKLPPKQQPNHNSSEQSPLLSNSTPDAESQSPVQPIPKPNLPLGLTFRLAPLFGIDSLASAMVSQSFIAYQLRLAFNAPITTITSIISATSVVAGLSVLLSGPIAHRFGLIQTMFMTHVPTQFLIIGFAFAPSLALASVLLIVRSSIMSMDSAPRNAFLAAIIPAESRTKVLGTLNIVKTLSASLGPSVSGALASTGRLYLAFVLAGTLKLLYDVELFISFRSTPLEY